MITVLVDTREQKTPAIIERFKMEHKIMAKDYEFIPHSLPIADFFGNNQLVEYKGGKDIHSSTYGPDHHLLNQIIRMSIWLEDHPGTRGHLVCADSPDYSMSRDTMKVVFGWCQDYGIRFHHRLSLDAGVLLVIHLIRDPPVALKRIVPLTDTKKSPFLIRVLSQIDGVSPEFAEFALWESDKTLQDIIDTATSDWRDKLQAFYHKDMGSLLDKILEAIG